MPLVSESTGEHRGENLNSYTACPEMWALKGCERVRNHDFQQTLHISLTHTKVGQALVLTSQQAILCPTNSTENGPGWYCSRTLLRKSKFESEPLLAKQQSQRVPQC